MAGQYDNTNRGALFRNKKKQPGDNRPDYTGKLDIDGTEYFISGWVKKSGAGVPYLSLARQTDNRPQQPAKPAAQAAAPGEQFQDEDIPF